jgi:ATP-binding cassette subfamily C protein
VTAQRLPTATAAETWRALRALTRGRRLLAAVVLAVLVAGAAVGLLVPPILGHIVDVVVDGRPASAVTAPVLLLVGVAVADAVLAWVGEILVARLGETMLAELRERVVDSALALPLERVEAAGRGDVVARVSGDVAVIATAVRLVLPAMARAGLTIGLTVIGLAALDWRFAVAGLLAAPIQLHTLRWYLRRSAPVFAAERVAEGDRTQQLLDSIAGAETVHAFGLTTRHVSAVRDRSQRAVDYALTENRLSTRFYGRLNLAEFVGLAAILAVGFWLVDDGAATVGAAAAAALYFHRIFDPVNTVLGLFGTAQEAGAGLARLVGIADLPPVSVGAGGSAGGSVQVSDVGFSYGGGVEVLHDVSLTVAPGEHVALVGASGAGKTTLAKLIAGIHQPSRGKIQVGPVALITQEVHVFAGPLADDVRLGRPDATDAEVRAALAEVGADWVDSLPEGLATAVGEGGHQLTATQAQQLALARLIVADPAIAILDEATADAGSAGARILDRAAEHAVRGRTAIIVAHRLSQASRADRVVVLDEGRVVESGPPAELAAGDGPYAALWAAWSAVG